MAALMPFMEAPPHEAEAAQADTALDVIGEVNGLGGVKKLTPEQRAYVEAQREAIRENKEWDKSRAALIREAEAENRKISKKRGVDVNRLLLPVLAKPHSELSNLMWARAAVLKELSTRSISVERREILTGVPQEMAGLGRPAQYYFRLTKPGSPNVPAPIPHDTVPWWGLSGEHDRGGAYAFSTNSKMNCPTFDLPAGSGPMAGTCPGAIAGQSVVPEKTRLAAAKDVIEATGHYSLEKSVCEYCYATGSKYAEASTQMKELIVFGFVRRMVMGGPESRAVLAKILYEGVLGAEEFFLAGDPTRRFGFLPVRVHSSGDFFDKDYAQVWLDVAWMLLKNEQAGGRKVILWAPTRTQVNAGFAKFWATAKVPENFVIRPSGFHVDDAAPRPVMTRYTANGQKIAGAEGTSVIHKDIAPAAMGEKYDFQCQTYGLDEGSRTCAISSPPLLDSNGNPVRNERGGVSEDDETCGCRACWLRPELRVNYAFH